jgi:hypothetical protein
MIVSVQLHAMVTLLTGEKALAMDRGLSGPQTRSECEEDTAGKLMAIIQHVDSPLLAELYRQLL